MKLKLPTDMKPRARFDGSFWHLKPVAHTCVVPIIEYVARDLANAWNLWRYDVAHARIVAGGLMISGAK